jgi:DNA-binding PadR family transcriptional regulator
MALEHAILVSLSEQSGSGLDLTRRFDRSIGFFWTATHQQIYRVLARMEADGWVRSATMAQPGRSAKKVYDVTDAGRAELTRWLAEPLVREQHRSDLAVRLRAASYGDRAALLGQLVDLRADHGARLDLYRRLEERDYPDPAALSGRELDQYLVLRGGVLLEEFWLRWLDEYLTAHDPDRAASRGER